MMGLIQHKEEEGEKKNWFPINKEHTHTRSDER
jgi:hypothetical protein